MANSGYGKFSALMGGYSEYTVCRKFGTLGARRILFLQAEIAHLERKLRIIFEVDEADPPKAEARSWIELRSLSVNDEDSQSKTFDEAFAKLDEYYSVLLRTKQILDLPSATPSECGFLKYWLQAGRGGNLFLQGLESDIYDGTHDKDLISLHCNAENDPFAHFLTNKIKPLFHRICGIRFKARIPDEENLGPLWDYKHSIFVLLADIICATLSSIIPVASIFLLYYIPSNLKRLVVITVMSFIFSFVMAIVVRGRRPEVFAASMAFAAVQVVFVGGVNFLPMN